MLRRFLPFMLTFALLAASVVAQTVESTDARGLGLATGAASPTTLRVNVAQNGNVGMGGIVTPSTKLDVNGTISASQVYSGGVLKGFPIGVVIPWHKSMTGVAPLPDGWLECNGQTISDAASPMNGQAVPDLNSQVYAGGRGRYIRGGNTSGGTNASTKLTGNGGLYQFSYGSSGYYGIGYGIAQYSEVGNPATYSGSNDDLTNARAQVAAMTVVFIIKIK
ncbi:hypothetical protein [Hyphomicrobium sp.]|uniref:hypothetical protein n=1 Tax=Hyphomicrobium sp. TaxID=82 RepID=UPI002E37A7B5|nr:hypothetical protein [Hyphomicrobium sp.]HEX2842104.1 hypothetical protein [Hyphomicrobium sp.]